MAAPSIAASLEWRASVQGKRCLIGSVRCIGKEDPSATSCDRQGSIAARSPNGSGLTRFPCAMQRRRKRLRHVISKNIYRAAGRRVVRAAGVCSKRSRRALYGSFSNLERLLGKWRNPKRKMVRPVLPALGAPSVDPATGRLISPIVAAALCVSRADHYQAPRRRKLTCSKANDRTSPPCDGSPCGSAAFCEARMLVSLASG